MTTSSPELCSSDRIQHNSGPWTLSPMEKKRFTHLSTVADQDQMIIKRINDKINFCNQTEKVISNKQFLMATLKSVFEEVPKLLLTFYILFIHVNWLQVQFGCFHAIGKEQYTPSAEKQIYCVYMLWFSGLKSLNICAKSLHISPNTRSIPFEEKYVCSSVALYKKNELWWSWITLLVLRYKTMESLTTAFRLLVLNNLNILMDFIDH